MTKVTYIDPPSGWKYGFPKPLPDPKPENIIEWLISQGYPQKEIDSFGEHFYSRYWESDWNCPIGNTDCKENCGNYGCRN
jgi:hypothetical protein